MPISPLFAKEGYVESMTTHEQKHDLICLSPSCDRLSVDKATYKSLGDLGV